MTTKSKAQPGETPTLPLYFNFKDLIFGQGFVAGVKFVGRASCREEYGSTWIYGVNPGALAENGDDMRAAYAAFRERLKGILVDIAIDAETSFKAFSEEARSFVAATDPDTVLEWEAARQKVRAGSVPDVDLPLETSDLELEIEVVKLRISPDLNELDVDGPPELLAA